MTINIIIKTLTIALARIQTLRYFLCVYYRKEFLLNFGELSKAQRKRTLKNAKQMQNTKRSCFSHSSASPRNDKQRFDKHCFANQTNRCPAGFASRCELFRGGTYGKQNIDC